MTPTNKDKHFIVSKIELDEEGLVILCYIDAVMSKRPIPIDWHELKDKKNGFMAGNSFLGIGIAVA